MDLNLVADCKMKLRVLGTNRERIALIYQWVLTRRIRLQEFHEILDWHLANPTITPPPQPEPEVAIIAGSPVLHEQQV